LNSAGTNPELRHSLINTNRKGPTVEKTSFNNLVGIKSIEQFVLFICCTISSRNDSEIGSNCSNTLECVAATTETVAEL